MAIYTYLCPKCNRRFDILKGKEKVICNLCQNRDLVRVFTPPMVKTSKGEGLSSCGSCTRTSCAGCK